MPVSFSGRCPVCLLLLLCISFSGGSPAGAGGTKGDPAMTTQDSNQTWVNSVTKMQAGHDSSDSLGPDAATQELKPASMEYTHVLEYTIVLPGVAEKSISLACSAKVELTCKLHESSNLKNPQVTWKKGSETISHTSKTQNSWTIQLTISGSSELGNYTCILKAEKELRATFHLHVPEINAREKPIITYEGDTAVMVCKTVYRPKAWTWYTTNGTELVPIDKILPMDKFKIKRTSARVNCLEILKLTKEDHGAYWCEAAFELGVNKARFELRVLSISVPLKPLIAIVAEVAIFVTGLVLYEMYSKRKARGGQREFDQIDQRKSEDNKTKGRKKLNAET